MSIKIDLHAGHGTSLDGSYDPGCAWNGYTEASLCLAITRQAVAHLRASGITVYSDSDHNNNKNMTADVSDANKRNSRLYVSVHCDYSLAPSGVMPMYVSSEGKKIATALNTSIKAGMKMKSRGIKNGKGLYELEATEMPAVILECGAIKADINTLKKAEAYGEAIAKGLCSYLGVKYKEATTSSKAVATTVQKFADTTISAAQLKSLQKILGVSQSGYIGGQNKANSLRYTGFYKVCKFDGGSGKSTTVKALQKALKVAQSGLLDTVTIKAFQKYLNGHQSKYKLDIDGYFGDESTKALIWWLAQKPTRIKVTTSTKTSTTAKKTTAKAVTSSNVRRAKFLISLKKVADDCIKHKFVYSNNGSKTTYKAALKSNKRINCARYVSWALQDAGLLPKGKVIWLSNKVNGNGASYVKKSKYLKVTYPKKIAKKCSLKPGDIVGYNVPHTQVAANSKGTSWYSAGGSDVRAHKYYYRRKAGYDSKKVYVKIRIV